jgi:hypothetical protein
MVCACGCLVLLAGCYERVVAASGPGADKVKVEKGNLPDPKGDKVLGYKKMELKRLPGE